jgi:hypothetical protein
MYEGIIYTYTSISMYISNATHSCMEVGRLRKWRVTTQSRIQLPSPTYAQERGERELTELERGKRTYRDKDSHTI